MFFGRSLHDFIRMSISGKDFSGDLRSNFDLPHATIPLDTNSVRYLFALL